MINKNNFIAPLLFSVLFSFFIYSEHYGILNTSLILTIVALSSYILLFLLDKKTLFFSGFYTAILWFWWIALSFNFYDLDYLIPIVIIGIGLIYGALFFIIGLSNHYLYRLLIIFTITYVEPFGFNWFKLELPLINSYLGTSKIEFLAVLVLTFILVRFYKVSKVGYSLFYLLGIYLLANYHNDANINIPQPHLKIYTYNTHISQEDKWNKLYKNDILNDNIIQIDQAIKEGYDLIVFPETAFPLVLNKVDQLLDILKDRSAKISILLGALHKKDGMYHNSTFLFQDKKIQIAHKVVLVPFGEAVPLPEVLRDMINNLFYKGAKDYDTAKYPTTFNIKGIKFRSSICYESTTDKIYENLDTKYTIAISNNRWFTPSIEPTLQKLLQKYYTNKYKVLMITANNS